MSRWTELWQECARGFNGAAFFQSGKSERARCPARRLSASFNGAAFFQSGKSRTQSSVRLPAIPLQWSRFFSKRKMCDAHADDFAAAEASMEPLFFKAENNHYDIWVGYVRPGLQWSRFFSKRKINAETESNRTQERFNGAAFFQSGKCGPKTQETQMALKLQWSRFFSKRKMSGRVVDWLASMELQWSRFFSKRKMLQARLLASGRQASMEPLFFKAENEKCKNKTDNGRRPQLQWSRFFSKRKMGVDS